MNSQHLLDLLNKLYLTLKSVNSPLIPYFQEGKTRSEIIDVFNKAEIDPLEELILLYQWKNGIDLEKAQQARSETWLLPFGGFTPLEYLIKIYKNLSGSDKYWTKNLINIFDSTIGEYYLIDCDKKSNTYGQIFFYSYAIIDFNVIISAFDSLESCLKTILECYQRKIFNYSESNSLDYDDDEFNKICAEINPKSELWPLYLQNNSEG